MKFYSYKYLESQIKVFNSVQIALIIILLGILAFGIIMYYKRQYDSKYREISILAFIGILLSISSYIGDYKEKEMSDNRTKGALWAIDSVSEKLEVDHDEIYINMAAASDGAVVKVRDDFYRIIFIGDSKNYLLEKMEVYKPDIEIVEGGN